MRGGGYVEEMTDIEEMDESAELPHPPPSPTPPLAEIETLLHDLREDWSDQSASSSSSGWSADPAWPALDSDFSSGSGVSTWGEDSSGTDVSSERGDISRAHEEGGAGSGEDADISSSHQTDDSSDSDESIGRTSRSVTGRDGRRIIPEIDQSTAIEMPNRSSNDDVDIDGQQGRQIEEIRRSSSDLDLHPPPIQPPNIPTTAAGPILRNAVANLLSDLDTSSSSLSSSPPSLMLCTRTEPFQSELPALSDADTLSSDELTLAGSLSSSSSSAESLFSDGGNSQDTAASTPTVALLAVPAIIVIDIGERGEREEETDIPMFTDEDEESDTESSEDRGAPTSSEDDPNTPPVSFISRSRSRSTSTSFTHGHTISRPPASTLEPVGVVSPVPELSDRTDTLSSDMDTDGDTRMAMDMIAGISLPLPVLDHDVLVATYMESDLYLPYLADADRESGEGEGEGEAEGEAEGESTTPTTDLTTDSDTLTDSDGRSRSDRRRGVGSPIDLDTLLDILGLSDDDDREDGRGGLSGGEMSSDPDAAIGMDMQMPHHANLVNHVDLPIDKTVVVNMDTPAESSNVLDLPEPAELDTIDVIEEVGATGGEGAEETDPAELSGCRTDDSPPIVQPCPVSGAVDRSGAILPASTVTAATTPDRASAPEPPVIEPVIEPVIRTSVGAMQDDIIPVECGAKPERSETSVESGLESAMPVVQHHHLESGAPHSSAAESFESANPIKLVGPDKSAAAAQSIPRPSITTLPSSSSGTVRPNPKPLLKPIVTSTCTPPASSAEPTPINPAHNVRNIPKSPPETPDKPVTATTQIKPTTAALASAAAPITETAPPGPKTVNILILGASLAGISCVHFIMKHIFPALPKHDRNKGTKSFYRVTILAPETHFFWRVGAPRFVTDPDFLLAHTDSCFIPLQESLRARYPIEMDPTVRSLVLEHGRAVGLDPARKVVLVSQTGIPNRTAWPGAGREGVRTITAEEQEKGMYELRYDALVIATGTQTSFDLLNAQFPGESLEFRMKRYRAFSDKIKRSKTVVVAGAGSSGVEVACEIADALAKKPSGAGAGARPRLADGRMVILVASGDMVLNRHNDKFISTEAHDHLTDLAVTIHYNTKVTEVEKLVGYAGSSDGNDDEFPPVRISLDDGIEIMADLFVDCTLTTPNTDFMPPEWMVLKHDICPHPPSHPPKPAYRLYTIKTDPKSLRIVQSASAPDEDEAPIYAVGDVNMHSPGGGVATDNTVVAAMSHLGQDLISQASKRKWNFLRPDFVNIEYDGRARPTGPRVRGWPNPKKGHEVVDYFPDSRLSRGTTVLPIGSFDRIGMIGGEGVEIPECLMAYLLGSNNNPDRMVGTKNGGWAGAGTGAGKDKDKEKEKKKEKKKGKETKGKEKDDHRQMGIGIGITGVGVGASRSKYGWARGEPPFLDVTPAKNTLFGPSI